MLRMRRTLAFSARIHNYLLLLHLFFVGLYFSRLWWSVTEEFTSLSTTLATVIAVTGIVHAAVLLIMSLVIWIADRLFPAWEFWGTVLRVALIIAFQLLISMYASVTTGGLTVSL